VFDAYTIAFGIRNVTHIDQALAEAFRVLKFGGRFFCLEFSTTEWPGFREAYDAYSHKLVPQIGKAIAARRGELPLPDRIDPPLPADARVRAMIRAAGFERTKVEPILGGLVAIHSGGRIW
jgi:demethylmenaquinone methyltransferase/2-methoxy-6-polyprenyl-1,4-benzoquinol methylase